MSPPLSSEEDSESPGGKHENDGSRIMLTARTIATNTVLALGLVLSEEGYTRPHFQINPSLTSLDNWGTKDLGLGLGREPEE